MTVEVRNLQSGETFQVGPDGAVFGREGGPANIKVPDQSVSKRHARIFTDGSGWFLEDMGSVNGTLVDGGKIGTALPLKAGIVFQMSKFRFEVMTIDGRGARAQANPEQETRTAQRGNGSPGNSVSADLRKDVIPKRRPVQAPVEARNTNLPLAADGDFPSSSDAATNKALDDDDGPRPVLGIDSYDDELAPPAALAMGIGYTLKTAPLLVLNPLGTVRKQIESPPLPGLQKIPLAVLVLPVYGVTFVAQSLVGGIAGAIASGSIPFGSLIIGPIIGVIVAAIAAAIAGFLAHPVLTWLITKLGGTSDARSRTTHLAMGMVTTLVLLVPTMLATLLSAIAARLTSVSSAFALINIVPALLMIVATPLPIFVQWSWFRSYNVVKWFQTLLLVFAVLGVVGGVAGAISTVLGAVQAMRGSSSGIVVPDVPDVPDVDVPDAPSGAKEPGNDPVKDAAKDAAKDPVKDAAKDPVKDAAKDPVKADAPPIKAATKDAPVGGGDYGEYLRKLAAIEAALERDPTLLEKQSFGPKYQTLSRQTYSAEEDAVDDVLGKKKRSDPAEQKYLDKMKALYVFRQTRDTVNELFKALPK